MFAVQLVIFACLCCNQNFYSKEGETNWQVFEQNFVIFVYLIAVTVGWICDKSSKITFPFQSWGEARTGQGVPGGDWNYFHRTWELENCKEESGGRNKIHINEAKEALCLKTYSICAFSQCFSAFLIALVPPLSLNLNLYSIQNGQYWPSNWQRFMGTTLNIEYDTTLRVARVGCS